jgi:hypothetical protein
VELYRMSETRSVEWAFTALHGAARCLVAEGQYEAALVAYRRVLDLRPDAPVRGGRRLFHLRDVPPLASCETRLPMALLLLRLEQPEEAVAQLDSVISHCARDGDMHRRASALREQVSAVLRQRSDRP